MPKPSVEFSALWNEISCIKFDGVLINTRFYAHTMLGIFLARKNGIVPVVLDHGSAHLTFGNSVLDVLVRLYEHGITSLVKSFRPVFYGISDKSVEWLQHFNIKAEGVIPNSIDAARFRASASHRSFREELGIGSDLLLAFTGRFVPEKGISTLLSMMSMLKDPSLSLLWPAMDLFWMTFSDLILITSTLLESFLLKILPPYLLSVTCSASQVVRRASLPLFWKLLHAVLPLWLLMLGGHVG